LHFTWIYPHRLEVAAVDLFNERIARGLLGRLLQRSPLPFGRHRWVVNSAPAPITWVLEEISADRLPAWRSSLVDLPVDPEYGPGWRLAVQCIEGGGCAMSILISHTIADCQAALQAIVEASTDSAFQPRFPIASRRWSFNRILRDSQECLRALPDVLRALSLLVRQGNIRDNNLLRSAGRPHLTGAHEFETVVDVPLVSVVMDSVEFAGRAQSLNVASNSLFMLLAVRLAFRMGRVNPEGHVNLVLPVSDRRAGDTRGNALSSVTIVADPELCIKEPLRLQRQARSALTKLIRNGDPLTTLLPLVPFIPLALVRHLEDALLGTDLAVACTLLPPVRPELGRVCSEASFLQMSGLERYTAPVLARMGGRLYLTCYRFGEREVVTISGYSPKFATTRSAIAELVRDSLADIGLRGTVDVP
jgi:hypothetical protein